MFMLIKAEVEYNSGDYQNALLTCESAYEINGIKDKNTVISIWNYNYSFILYNKFKFEYNCMLLIR